MQNKKKSVSVVPCIVLYNAKMVLYHVCCRLWGFFGETNQRNNVFVVAVAVFVVVGSRIDFALLCGWIFLFKLVCTLCQFEVALWQWHMGHNLLALRVLHIHICR